MEWANNVRIRGGNRREVGMDVRGVWSVEGEGVRRAIRKGEGTRRRGSENSRMGRSLRGHRERVVSHEYRSICSMQRGNMARGM